MARKSWHAKPKTLRLAEGADPAQKSSKGRTAEDLAKEEDHNGSHVEAIDSVCFHGAARENWAGNKKPISSQLVEYSLTTKRTPSTSASKPNVDPQTRFSITRSLPQARCALQRQLGRGGSFSALYSFYIHKYIM